MKNYIVGLAAYYHDSSACILGDGQIIAAAQEERFSRIKHDSAFPRRALAYCLEEGNIDLSQVRAIVFYDKPLLKFDRLLETYLSFAPKGFKSFCQSMPVWLKEKLFLKATLRKQLSEMSGLKVNQLPQLYFSEHHQAHAGSAYFPSPFDSSAVLCLDGVGEWATTSAWLGEKNTIKPLWQINFPHSLGLLYSAFTYFTGFKVNSGEYKVMGLAPYGEPKFVDLIFENIIDVKADGSFRLNMDYFSFATDLKMTNKKFSNLFGVGARLPNQEIRSVDLDLAASVQVVVEEIILKLATSLYKETGNTNLCMAGGVALNCVANGRLRKEGPYKNIWIQPAAGDSGGALGAAMALWHQYFNNERLAEGKDSMNGAFLGPSYDSSTIQFELDRLGASYSEVDNFLEIVSKYLAEGKIVGWFQGRMEFGPRALGGRSILADPRRSEMQKKLNLKIKNRESFRPFAPAVLREKLGDYFHSNDDDPYMLFVSSIIDKQRRPISVREDLSATGAKPRKDKIFSKLDEVRSTIPAVTHVDFSARVQTVSADTHSEFYKLLKRFELDTQCPVLINTSFNVRGEPIVCSVEDAYRCFMATDIDILAVQNYILKKEDQPNGEGLWESKFPLD